MLEKQRQKKKAIGTLDVAFKKRFFALNNQAQGLDGAAPEGGKVARKMLDSCDIYMSNWWLGDHESVTWYKIILQQSLEINKEQLLENAQLGTLLPWALLTQKSYGPL